MGALCTCRHLTDSTVWQDLKINFNKRRPGGRDTDRLGPTEELEEESFDAHGRKVRLHLEADGEAQDGSPPPKGRRVQDRKATGIVTKAMIPPESDEEDEDE
mmetsp:Transcript_39129/g.84509  ORF Transcript_39129/g.84509 Transcript_39129/m.84509 type:complete len:102 (+) Transcript_39129:138-443(+)